MNYSLVYDILKIVENFENTDHKYNNDVNGFTTWLFDKYGFNQPELKNKQVDWEGKNKGRSADSVISTLLVHLNRYAKNYSKCLMHNSPFTSQDDFIFLINLKAFGTLTKMELIKKNIQDKPTGILIINRLIKNNWVKQIDSEIDKRKKIIQITEEGTEVLELYMNKIREASRIVSGNLSDDEKLELIYLLSKLETFHSKITEENYKLPELIDKVNDNYLNSN